MGRGNSEFRRVRRRCAARVRELSLPQPFDAHALCRAVAVQRGREIRVLPMEGGDSGVLGLWVATEQADLICYEANTTPPHQEHIILHELCHLLCNHYPAQLSTTEHMRMLMPDLDPRMVQRILGRTSYGAAEEHEAELMATLIRQAASPGSADSVAGKINEAFDWPGHG